jgi:predicted transcriptional regulator
MRDEDTGAIPIVEDEQLCGIVTDRDIVIRCIAEGKDPAEITVDQILSEDLETIDPDADVQEAADLMARKQIRRLPVVEEGCLVGVVSLGDIAVKHEDEQAAGEALQEVSQGVKEQDRKPARGVAQPQRAAGREAGLREAGTRRQAPAKAMRRASSGKQAISHQASGKEQKRQEKVVPFREEAKGSGKRRAS